MVCGLALQAVPGAGEVRFRILATLLILLATITLPLFAGLAVNHFAPTLSRRVLRPVEILSEATGLLSLSVITATEFRSMLVTDWRAVVAMILSSELSLALGYSVGGQDRATRRVIALGTSNRNIALALLVAVESFAGTPVVPMVVTNGVILILLGLLHVAFWRLVQDRPRSPSPSQPPG